MIRFILNEQTIETDMPPGSTLLDFIRYRQHLPGTKIGCREGDCGACTVLVGERINDELQYLSMTSCLLPLGNVNGKHIVTVEGINFPKELNVVQQAMADCGATQCGFCTPGFVVSLAGFCLSRTEPTKENAIAAVDGNICRCTGYKSIEKAAAIVAQQMEERGSADPIEFVTQKKMLPEYFTGIGERLLKLKTTPFTIHDSRFTSQDSSHTILAGGTDLYVQRHDEIKDADIRFLFDHPKLDGIRKEGNTCIIGASVTVSDLLHSPIIREAFPDFPQYARLISSTPIRNMATIAGNFVNASPIGDLTILFLALDARLTLALSINREETETVPKRVVPLRRFYKGYKQLDKRQEEFIEDIAFELPRNNTYFNFEKVSKRTHLDIASVNTAICLHMNGDVIENAGLSAGGVGPVPVYLDKTSRYLQGQLVNEETIAGAIAMMQTEISPISDARGTKEYKTLLLGQLIKSHFIKLFQGR